MVFTNGDWNKVKEIVKEKACMNHISYLTWIDPLTIKHTESHKVVLSVPHYAPDNAFAMQYINNHYGDYIKAAISEYLGESVEIELS